MVTMRERSTGLLRPSSSGVLEQRFGRVFGPLLGRRNAPQEQTPKLDLLMARSQLRAGIAQHQVGKWLGAKALEWPRGLGADFEWQLGLAQHTGGSLNHAINAWLAQQEHLAAMEQEKQVALQGPKLTAKLTHFVPWLALLLAQAFGLNPLGFLFGSTMGWILLAVSVLLSWLAYRWTNRIVRLFSEVTPGDPGVCYSGLALMLRSGLGVGSGLKLLNRNGLRVPQELNVLVATQTRVGAGLAAVLQTQAEWERSKSRQKQREDLARLPIRLLYPLAVLLLPQFMLLTVLPIAASAFAGN
jgi:tight adherence protein B